MPALTPDDVARLAALARIDLAPDELERLAGELDAVVAAVASVSSVVADAAEDVPATSHPLPLTDVYREDVVGAVLDADEVLAGAPAAQDGRFLVPQILEED